MQNYSEMTPAARLEALDAMATAYYDTPQWRKLFAAEYGLANQTLTNWKIADRTPVWACVAMHHAVEARKLADLRRIIAG